MSEQNELESLEYPLRPHVGVPSDADGTDIVDDAEISQLAGVYPFDFIPDKNNLDYYSSQNLTPYFKLILKDIDEAGGDVDISEYVTSWGNITRSVDYLTGKMSPSSHSFKLANTKDSGAYLFTLRNNIGTSFWMGKEYDLYVGFRVNNIIEWHNVYTGNITKKTEDRIQGSVSVNSNDIIKELNDYKICSIIKAEDVFEIVDGTKDDRSIQQCVKYGIHKLNTNNNNKELEERSSPFSITECIPNKYESYVKSSSVAYKQDANYIWFIPIQNNIQTTSITWGDDLEIYYWDYISKIWVAFTTAEISTMVITDYSFLPDGVGTYITMTTDFTMNNSNFSTWSDYIDSTNENYDISVAIESKSIVQVYGVSVFESSQNPVSILQDLPTNNKLINYDSTELDYSSFSTPDVDNYSWDKAYNDYDGLVNINTNYNSETSIMNVINDICGLTGISFFAGKKYSNSEDRRIKLLNEFPINPIINNTSNAIYSTKDKINKYVVSTDSSKQKTKVIGLNFNSSTSTKKEFEQYSVEKTLSSDEFEKVQTFGNIGGNVYLYNSGSFAKSLIQLFYNSVSNPVEISNVGLGKAGFNINIGQLIDVHDSISDEKTTTRVYNINQDVKSLITSVIGKRFQLQYGPDVDYPCRKWCYVDSGRVTDSDCPSGGYNGESWYVF